MTKRKVVMSSVTGPTVLGGNVAKALAGARDTRDVLGLPQPVVPKPVAWQQTGDGLLVFDGQTITVELTGVITTDGKAPVVAVQEYEGRRPRTALDSAPLGTCSVPMIVRANAQYVHDVILHRCAAGQVLRVYGPMVGPYGQGDVWCFAGMPKPEVVMPMNADGTIRTFRLTLELGEWQPMGSLTPTAGTRVGTDGPRRMASLDPASTTIDTAGIFDRGSLGTRLG